MEFKMEIKVAKYSYEETVKIEPQQPAAVEPLKYQEYSEGIRVEVFTTKTGVGGFILKLSKSPDNFGTRDLIIRLDLRCIRGKTSSPMAIWYDLYLQDEHRVGCLLIDAHEFRSINPLSVTLPEAGGEISFGCHLTVHEFPTDIRAGVANKEEPKWGMEVLLNNRKFTDVEIEVAGRSFPVHKAIISSRSEVFEAMFKHDTVEKRTGKVKIEDVEPEAMEQFVHFLYTDDPPNMGTLSKELWLLSDKYAVGKLKNLAEDQLIETLHLENVVEMLEWSHLRLGTERVKTAAVEFVIGRFKEVVKMKEWRAFHVKYPLLIDEIMCKMSDKWC